jgi:hypothetical protein
VAPIAAAEFSPLYPLKVSPPECRHMKDDQTGVDLTFLTSGDSKNKNLYFHERSWLQDSSLILFTSQRKDGGQMGYLTATGELLRLTARNGKPLGRATATGDRPTFYAMEGNRVLEVALKIEPSDRPEKKHSKVWASERFLCEMPDTVGSLNESCDGRYLSLGGNDPGTGKSAIFTIDTATGAPRRVCGMPPGTTLGISHLQWSRTNPFWVSFANAPIRIWVTDIRDGKTWAPYLENPGELVTHESWWVNDQIIFCGGIHPKPTEDAHVKCLDPRTGQVRIIGEGAWWPEAKPPEIAKRNWWHCAGSAEGNWIAADNWHGDIMLFEGLTARPRLLTTGHRTYGHGDHPEVGWDRQGKQVVFASHKLGGKGVHVCVATIPEKWQQEIQQYGKRIDKAP